MSHAITCRSRSVLLLSAATALIASLPCRSANAEYRCATPRQLAPADARACLLAQQDTPDALVHFVARTKRIYNLAVDDYVSKADVERWELARHGQSSPDTAAVANARGATQGASKDD